MLSKQLIRFILLLSSYVSCLSVQTIRVEEECVVAQSKTKMEKRRIFRINRLPVGLNFMGFK